MFCLVYQWSCGSVSQNHIWSSPDHRSRNSFWALPYIIQANSCCPLPLPWLILSYLTLWDEKCKIITIFWRAKLFLTQNCIPKHCQVLLFRALQKSTRATQNAVFDQAVYNNALSYWKTVKIQLLFSHHMNYNIFKFFLHR